MEHGKPHQTSQEKEGDEKGEEEEELLHNHLALSPFSWLQIVTREKFHALTLRVPSDRDLRGSVIKKAVSPSLPNRGYLMYPTYLH